MTPILHELTLKAYRGLAQLQLGALAPVTLIVGANNSGKSSILEAAGLLLRPPDPGQWVSAVRRRDADMGLVDGLWSMFPGAEALHPDDGAQASKPLSLRARLTAGERQVVATAWASEMTSITDESNLTLRIDVSVNGDPPIELRFPSSKTVAHQVPTYRVMTVTPASHYSTKWLVEQLSRVVDEGKKALAVELLQVFDPQVEDLDVVASLGREAVRVTHAGRGVVDLSSFGDGMRRAATLALSLTRASQGVLLADEIETGIHPSILKQVIEKLLVAAEASQVQLIATTHSLEAVDAVMAAVEERQNADLLATFWLRRREGSHEARRYSLERLRRMRESGLDVR